MVLALGNMRHFVHRTAIGENIPLAPQAFVAEEVEQSLRGNGQPNGGGGAENNAGGLARVVHALPGHNPHIFVHIPRAKLVPLVDTGSAHPSTEVISHALRQLQHAPPPTRTNSCRIKEEMIGDKVGRVGYGVVNKDMAEKKERTYFGVAIRHILDYTTGRESAGGVGCGRRLSDGVDGHVHHSPHPFRVLLTEAEKVYFAYRY
nr:hypothetical protein ACMD2_04153 [Ipomoea batatas]